MTSYYVATTGDDEDSGATDAPFATVGHAISVVAPGDTIYVRDGTYYEALTLSADGTAGSGITLTSDTGASPILSGAQLKSGFALSFGKTYTYEVAQTVAVSGVFEDTATKLTSRASIALVEANAGSYFYDDANDLLHMHCTDGADPATHTIEAAVNAYHVHVTGDYWTVSGLTIQHSAASGVRLSAGTSHVTECTLRYNVGAGAYIDSDNARLTRCKAHNNTGQGVFVYADGVTLEYNHVHHNTANGIDTSAIDGTNTDLVARYNFCHNNVVGIHTWYNDRAHIYRNTCIDNSSYGIEIDQGSDTAIVEHNICHGNGQYGVVCKRNENSMVRNNYCGSHGIAGIYVKSCGGSYGTDGTTVSDNMCADNALHGVYISHDAGAGDEPCENVVLSENSLISNASQITVAADNNPGFASDNNHFLIVAAQNAGTWLGAACETLTAWQTASSGDAASDGILGAIDLWETIISSGNSTSSGFFGL